MNTYYVSCGADSRVLDEDSEENAVRSFILILRCLGKIENQYNMKFSVRRLKPDRQRFSGTYMINVSTNEPVMVEKAIL